MINIILEKFGIGLLAIALSISSLLGINTQDLIDMNVLKDKVRQEVISEMTEDIDFGSTNFVAGKRYKLAGSGIGITDTSIILQSFQQPVSDTELVMSNFGSIGYATIEPGTSKKEFISFTGITQDGSSDKATLTGVTRGLQFVSPYTASSSLRQTHSGGVRLIISNPPQLYNRMAVKDNDESITGTWTFASSTIPTLDSYLAPTADAELASKKYVDDVALVSAPDITYTVKGVAELATVAELAAGTATGGTGTNLVAHSDFFNAASSATTLVPVTGSDGKLSQGFLDLTENYTWTGSQVFNTSAVDVNVAMDISGILTMSGANIVMADHSITGIDTLTFTDTAGTIAGVQNQNIVDKSAAEAITGAWTLSGAGTIDGVGTGDFVDKTATESISGDWTLSGATTLSGTITQSGTTTFSVIPTLPASDPTTDNQAVRKSYADTTGIDEISVETYTIPAVGAQEWTVDFGFGFIPKVLMVSAIGGDTDAISHGTATGTGANQTCVENSDQGENIRASYVYYNNTGADDFLKGAVTTWAATTTITFTDATTYDHLAEGQVLILTAFK